MSAQAFFSVDLPAAVNVAVGQVNAWPISRRIEEADQRADVIAGGADVLFADQPPHRDDVQPEQVRDAITFGLAILAWRPEGVTFAGLHWCATGHLGCPGLGRYNLPEQTVTRSTRGAYFTPRHLAEEVTFGALDTVLYDPGDLQTADRSKWRVLSSGQILGKHFGDIACGSGAFLLAGARYFADRLCEAWNVEAGLPGEEPSSAATVMQAKRLALGCMWGVDIDPLSVELCKLAVALLIPTIPVDLGEHVACGDALLGITSWAHILTMSFDPLGPHVFTGDELRVLMHAFQLGRAGKDLPFLFADLAVGAELSCAGKGKVARMSALTEAKMLARRVYASDEAIPEAQAKAREWLDTDLPAGSPPRHPLHWPLVFPKVFGYGAPQHSATLGKAS